MTDETGQTLQEAVNESHYRGDVEMESYDNPEDPDLVAVVTGEFANVGAALRLVRRSPAMTVKYVAHNGPGNATRIGIDVHTDHSGTLFTDE